MRRLDRKGQNTLEYALLIAVVVGGLFAIQTYLGRGMQGRVRSSVDSIGEQYSAGNMASEYTVDFDPQTTYERVAKGEGNDGPLGRGERYSASIGGKTTRTGSEELLKGLSEEKLLDE